MIGSRRQEHELDQSYPLSAENGISGALLAFTHTPELNTEIGKHLTVGDSMWRVGYSQGEERIESSHLPLWQCLCATIPSLYRHSCVITVYNGSSRTSVLEAFVFGVVQQTKCSAH